MKAFFRIFNIIICCGIIILVPDDYEYSLEVGIVALLYSLLTLLQVRENKNLVILFSIIFYINLSVFVLGPLTGGLTFKAYQFDLWNSRYDTIGMKCILTSSVVFYLVFRANKMVQEDDNFVRLSNRQNQFVSIICLTTVIFICILGYEGSAGDGEYVSNSNPLYEYVIFFMTLAWYYGGKLNFVKYIWVLCAALYVILGILAGDRSSSFMLLLLIALYKLRAIGLKKIIFFSFAGITLANAISLYRVGAESTGLAVYSIGLKSFFSDTAAQSYYSGITILYYLDRVNNDIIIFLKWIVTILTGSLFFDRSTVDLPKLAAEMNPNGGGGLFQASFFAFYGYWGVAIGSLFVSYLISKVFYSWRNTFSILLRFVIPAMSFRWYLYNPTAFFRACFINFGIIYLFVVILNNSFRTHRLNTK